MLTIPFRPLGISRSIARRLIRSTAKWAFAAAWLAFPSMLACADELYGWGRNTNGQLGNGTTTNSNVPVLVSGLGNGVTSASASVGHSLAIINGAAWSWGLNTNGQLGNGTTTSSSVAGPITSLSSGISAVAAGTNHSMAIQNGAAWTWGSNFWGQFGNGGFTNSSVPIAVPGMGSGVTAVGAGQQSNFVLQNGGLFSAGYNGDGQLGNGSGSSHQVVFGPVVGLNDGVTAFSTGWRHSLAIRNGVAWSWGRNTEGQLGHIGPGGVASPVPGLGSGITAVAAGFDHSLAIQNGNVIAFGDNHFGQIGNGTTSSLPTPPTMVLDLSLNLTHVAAGQFSSYALSADGSIWTWGRNDVGQLGLGDNTNRLIPTQLLAPSGFVYTGIFTAGNSSHVFATFTPIPEPSSILLASLAGVPILRRLRKRAS